MTSFRLTQWAEHAYRRRYILAPLLLLCIGYSAYVALTAAPTWKSAAALSPSKGFQNKSIALSSLTQQLGGTASLLGIATSGSDEERLGAIIVSRGFIEDLLKGGILQEMYPAQWEAKNKTWMGPPPSLEAAVKSFSLLCSASVDRQTGLIKVSMIAPSPQQAQAWLWRLINALNETERTRALAIAEINLVYLQSALNTETNKDLRDGLLGIVQSQLATRMLAKANRNFAVEVIDRPYLPELRNSPNRKLIVFEGGLIGLILCFLLLAIERVFPALQDFTRSVVQSGRKRPYQQ